MCPELLLFSLDFETNLKEVSFHPPNLHDSQERLLPAALIPICSFESSMSVFGQGSGTTCAKFQPTVLAGQMCYSIDISKDEKAANYKQEGIKLTMVIDPNFMWNNRLEGTPESEANIYLHTLSPYTSFRNGSYKLSALKRMTGSKDFMKLPLEKKKCHGETIESCSTRKYLQRVHNECQCLLWELETSSIKMVWL